MGKGFAFLAVLGAVALAVFSYAKTATSLLALKAQFNGLKVHNISLTEIICKVNLAIVNPNPSAMVANKITGNVIYKGSVISTTIRREIIVTHVQYNFLQRILNLLKIS